MVQVMCKGCGKEFKVKPSQIKVGWGKFCSKDCQFEAQQNQVTRICEECGKEFKTFPSNIKIGKGKFCSQDCHYESKKNQVTVICEECGIEFKIVPSRIKRGSGKFCSTTCFGVANSGENSRRYGKPASHGIGSLYDSIRNGPIWMRSTYELRFCQWADDLCYSYDWEHKAFEIEIEGKATTYRPDVFIRDLNLWIEIKGYWRDDAYPKFVAFKKRYPEERIVVMLNNELKRFENGESLEEIYEDSKTYTRYSEKGSK